MKGFVLAAAICVATAAGAQDAYVIGVSAAMTGPAAATYAPVVESMKAYLDHVNAHGLSTIPDDIWEAEGIRAALGATGVAVFAPKSHFGQLSAGSSAVELAASLLAMRDGVVPASLNCEQPDKRCPVTVACQPQPAKEPYFLKTAFTELGHSVALVYRRL